MREYEYEIQAWYTDEYGWELVATEQTYPEAKKQIKTYRENEPGVRFRIKQVVMEPSEADR